MGLLASLLQSLPNRRSEPIRSQKRKAGTRSKHAQYIVQNRLHETKKNVNWHLQQDFLFQENVFKMTGHVPSMDMQIFPFHRPKKIVQKLANILKRCAMLLTDFLVHEFFLCDLVSEIWSILMYKSNTSKSTISQKLKAAQKKNSRTKNSALEHCASSL